jgi:hypothetical protein
MDIKLIKETSERSDKDNWAKNALLSKSGLALESIEGCNQNAQNQITHLIERAFCPNLPLPLNLQDIAKAILNLEGRASLQRKLAFCRSFGLPLSYVLYGNSPTEYVKLFSIDKQFALVKEFSSYKEFSHWIKSVKGWVSTSAFAHKEELPFFDSELRKHGTAWPTNIDCFISSQNNAPKAILEFQNAHKTTIKDHSNNNYFWGLTPKDDQRRWFSQEILRVQSGLPFLILTWSKIHKGFVLKQVEKVVFPNFANTPLRHLLRTFVQKRVKDIGNKTARQVYDEICQNYESEELHFENGKMMVKVNKPPLSYEDKTFPMLYYGFKHVEDGNDEDKLWAIFNKFLI